MFFKGIAIEEPAKKVQGKNHEKNKNKKRKKRKLLKSQEKEKEEDEEVCTDVAQNLDKENLVLFSNVLQKLMLLFFQKLMQLFFCLHTGDLRQKTSYCVILRLSFVESVLFGIKAQCNT